jgi:hypothetical protein
VTVLSSVRSAIRPRAKELPLWQRQLALALAGSMDERPSASTAKELRSLLEAMLGDEASVPEAKVVDATDELIARRAARRAASG